MADTNEETLHLRCHKCNMVVQASVVCQYVHDQLANPGGDPVDSPHYVTVYKFAICPNCKSPFLYQQDYYEIPGEICAQQDEQLLFPCERDFPREGVAKTIRRAWEDAVGSYAAGLYDPCVIMCRKCLEAICSELGETSGSLQRRLKALYDREKLDKKLLEWANGLRMIGNKAAHELDAQIGQVDALDSLQFVEAIVMYVFSLSLRYEQFQRRRAGVAE